jgi:hypothetical protein
MKALFLVAALTFGGLGAQTFTTAQPKPVATKAIDGVEYAFYGKKFSVKEPIKADDLPEKMGNVVKMKTTVSGPVDQVCQKAGCWITMKVDGTPMRVWGYEKIFVPINSSGKQAVVTGYAVVETTSVEDLKHYAHDAGQSEEEIAKITEPKKELTFRATGIALY